LRLLLPAGMALAGLGMALVVAGVLRGALFLAGVVLLGLGLIVLAAAAAATAAMAERTAVQAP
jgi:hypothetical protein